MKYTRRQFLTFSAALLASRATANTLPTNPDVVIIGAGAAGVAAARQLTQNGLQIVVLEANNRIGGRIHTDTSTFGLPFDVGAHWLHAGEHNPFVMYGKRNGFDLYKDPENELVFVGNKPATREDIASYNAAVNATTNAIERAGGAGRDVSAASVLPKLGEWGPTARFQVGPYEMGKELEDFSCTDWYSGAEGTDWFCKQGFGALWRHSARDVAVQLNTKASVVHWGGNGVQVETNRGTIRAKSCIITVSTGVLAANDIRFAPELPVRKQEAFNAISMGLYNHVALQFDTNFLDAEPDTYITYKIDRSERGAVGLFANVSGSQLTFADFGGNFAWDMEAAGKRAAIDYAKSQLRKIFGSNVDKALRKASVTTWGSNILTRGSYASAQPGKYSKRRVLREPVGNRIWFAGEACSPTEWATVSGAHKSGDEVAKKVARAIGKT